MKTVYSVKIEYPNKTIAYLTVNNKTTWSKKRYAEKHMNEFVFFHGVKLEICKELSL